MEEKNFRCMVLMCFLLCGRSKTLSKKSGELLKPEKIFLNEVLIDKDSTMTNVTTTSTTFTEENQIARSQVCQKSIRHQGLFGSIVSPYYPREYVNNISCLWGVRSPSQHLLAIKLGEFVLEGGIQEKSENGEKVKEEKCSFDFLYIFEQKPRNSNLPLLSDSIEFRHNLGTFCGYIPPTTIYSTIPGSRVYFYFRSDASKTAKGFSLFYRIIPEKDFLSAHLGGLNDEDFNEVFPITKEEQFLKAFSCILFIFILFTVIIGTLYKCWQSTVEQIAMEGRAQHSCCCGTVQLDVIAAERRRCCVSPRLPTPPPDYGEIVKTEEDWNRIIQQLGEASAAALRQRRENEELQVTYNLDGNDDSNQDTRTTSHVTTNQPSSTSSLPQRAGHEAQTSNHIEVDDAKVKSKLPNPTS